MGVTNNSGCGELQLYRASILIRSLKARRSLQPKKA